MLFLSSLALPATLLVASTAARAIGPHRTLARRDLACSAADLTPENWIANDIDSFLASNPRQVDQHESNFPGNFVLSESEIDSITCTDPEKPELCTESFTEDTFCLHFDQEEAGFVIQSYFNIYTNLRNMFLAAQDAVDALNGEDFAKRLLKDISPEPLPFPRSTLLKIADITLDFIPAPPVGKGLEAFGKIVKRFVKVSGKAINNAESSAEAQENAIKNEPALIQGIIDQVVPTVQNAVRDQLQDIFSTAHSDNFHQDLLRDGVHLGKIYTREEYASMMATNLRAYLTAVAMNGITMQVVVDNLSVCENGDLRDAQGNCQRLLLPQSSIIDLVSAVTADHPSDLADMQVLTGLQTQDIFDNALDCAASGQTFQDQDLLGFLEGSSGGKLPKCMFGLNVKKQSF